MEIGSNSEDYKNAEQSTTHWIKYAYCEILKLNIAYKDFNIKNAIIRDLYKNHKRTPEERIANNIKRRNEIVSLQRFRKDNNLI